MIRSMDIHMQYMYVCLDSGGKLGQRVWYEYILIVELSFHTRFPVKYQVNFI